MGQITNLVHEAHQNAVIKGWWEEERTLGELIALINSEVSEALEDFRNGETPEHMWYERKAAGLVLKSEKRKSTEDKPCGIPSELADIVIRIFDLTGHYGWEERLEQSVARMHLMPPGPNQVSVERPFAENLTIIQGWLTDAYRGASDTLTISFLALAIIDTFRLAEIHSINLEKAIQEKMNYNATRPHRHGGKQL
ncbi:MULTISPECIES: nucleoside triphosphate pyrophosphohydrolase family protein [Paenibacillus]|uniref:hypothetical protein n=1 Tax=Paenibacillus TaxID=44249 RepID=UPI0011A4DE30|nr:hypothetical protein [Paenibacillus sp. IHBB 10380]